MTAITIRRIIMLIKITDEIAINPDECVLVEIKQRGEKYTLRITPVHASPGNIAIFDSKEEAVEALDMITSNQKD